MHLTARGVFRAINEADVKHCPPRCHRAEWRNLFHQGREIEALLLSEFRFVSNRSCRTRLYSTCFGFGVSEGWSRSRARQIDDFAFRCSLILCLDRVNETDFSKAQMVPSVYFSAPLHSLSYSISFFELRIAVHCRFLNVDKKALEATTFFPNSGTM